MFFRKVSKVKADIKVCVLPKLDFFLFTHLYLRHFTIRRLFTEPERKFNLQA